MCFKYNPRKHLTKRFIPPPSPFQQKPKDVISSDIVTGKSINKFTYKKNKFFTVCYTKFLPILKDGRTNPFMFIL